MRNRAKLALAVSALTLTAGCGGEASDEVDAIAAEVICEEFVKRELSAASTADFTTDTTQGGGSEWTVRGRVEADTRSGGRNSATYRCDLTYVGDGEWRLQNDEALRN